MWNGELYFFFFFSSRRRHTRFDCDWSSDVCSSDLEAQRRLDGIDVGAARDEFLQDVVLHRALQLAPRHALRSEEHTSELQSQSNLVCRLLLEKKKNASNALSRSATTSAWSTLCASA